MVFISNINAYLNGQILVKLTLKYKKEKQKANANNNKMPRRRKTEITMYSTVSMVKLFVCKKTTAVKKYLCFQPP